MLEDHDNVSIGDTVRVNPGPDCPPVSWARFGLHHGGDRSISGNVSYDATALTTLIVVGHDLPDDWTLDTKRTLVTELPLQAHSDHSTDKELFRFDAVVSEDARDHQH